MRTPQVSDRKGPVHALRAVFSGIGQAFLAADKLKEQAADAQRVAGQEDGASEGWSPLENPAAGSAQGPGGVASTARSGGQVPPGKPSSRAERSRRAAQAAAAEARWRSLDQTGNVRLLSADDLAAEFAAEPSAPAGGVSAAGRSGVTDKPGLASGDGAGGGSGAGSSREMIVIGGFGGGSGSGTAGGSGRPSGPGAAGGSGVAGGTSVAGGVGMEGGSAGADHQGVVPDQDGPTTARYSTPAAKAEPKPNPPTIVFIDESLQDPLPDPTAPAEAGADEAAEADEVEAVVGVAATEGPAGQAAEIIAAAEDPRAAEVDAVAAVVEAQPEIVTELVVAEPGAATAEEQLLPVPNYDALSLPSLRARLRNLDVAQLRTLADYERAHAGRPDVVTMFERRIQKLSAS
jgi:hypothetical protein